MSEGTNNSPDDIPMEEVNPTEEAPVPTAEKRPHKFPLAAARTRRVQNYGSIQDVENTVWDVYNNEARKVDTELVNDWRESLNGLLLFVSDKILPLVHSIDSPRRPSSPLS